jgi:hypothetical protein
MQAEGVVPARCYVTFKNAHTHAHAHARCFFYHKGSATKNKIKENVFSRSINKRVKQKTRDIHQKCVEAKTAVCLHQVHTSRGLVCAAVRRQAENNLKFCDEMQITVLKHSALGYSQQLTKQRINAEVKSENNICSCPVAL